MEKQTVRTGVTLHKDTLDKIDQETKVLKTRHRSVTLERIADFYFKYKDKIEY